MAEIDLTNEINELASLPKSLLEPLLRSLVEAKVGRISYENTDKAQSVYDVLAKRAFVLTDDERNALKNVSETAQCPYIQSYASFLMTEAALADENNVGYALDALKDIFERKSAPLTVRTGAVEDTARIAQRYPQWAGKTEVNLRNASLTPDLSSIAQKCIKHYGLNVT